MTPVMLATPPDNGPSPIPLFTDVGASSPTSPVIVPAVVEVTVTFTVAAVPCGMAAGDVDPFTVRVVVVVWKLPTARGHCVARLATFTEPNPVARSYPGIAPLPAAVVHAGVVAEAGLTSTPFVLAVVLLQFGLPPAQGTELLPLVMS